MVVTSVPCPARLGKVNVGGEQLRLVLAGPDDPPGADAVHAPGGSGDVDGDVVERAPLGGGAQLRGCRADSGEQLTAQVLPISAGDTQDRGEHPCFGTALRVGGLGT